MQGHTLALSRVCRLVGLQGHATSAQPCVLCCADAIVEGFSRQLQQPIPFAAVDSIVRDEQGQLKFHYVVVEVSPPGSCRPKACATVCQQPCAANTPQWIAADGVCGCMRTSSVCLAVACGLHWRLYCCCSCCPDHQAILALLHVIADLCGEPQAAAMASDPEATPVASDDVDGVQWMEVSKLRQLDSESMTSARRTYWSSLKMLTDHDMHHVAAAADYHGQQSPASCSLDNMHCLFIAALLLVIQRRTRMMLAHSLQ